MIRIHPLTTRLPPAAPARCPMASASISLQRAAAARTQICTGFSRFCGWSHCWRRLILGRALGLDLLRHKTSILREASFYQRLGLVHKCVRQRITAHVTHSQRLTFSLQHEINPSRQPVNAPRFNRSTDAQTVGASSALQGRQLGNRVVIGLALAVAKPRQKGHRHNDDPDTNPEFYSSLHGRRSNSA